MNNLYTPKPNNFKLAIHSNKVCSFCGAIGRTSILIKSPISDHYICQSCLKDIKEVMDEDDNQSNK